MRGDRKRDPNRPLDFLIFPASLGLKLHKHKSADIADAFKMAFYCGRELNGGVIAGAKQWSARKWLASAGIRRKIELPCSDLWHFSGNDLVVEIYDTEREKDVLSTRKTNSSNASKRWERICDRMTDKDKEEEEENFVVVDRAQEARRQAPVTFDELFEFLQAEYPDMPQEQIRKCADDYLRLGEKTNWTHSTGEPIHSWQATARGFAEKRLRRYSKRSGSGGGNARSMAEAEERERRRAELLEELEGVWPADSQKS